MLRNGSGSRRLIESSELFGERVNLEHATSAFHFQTEIFAIILLMPISPSEERLVKSE